MSKANVTAVTGKARPASGQQSCFHMTLNLNFCPTSLFSDLNVVANACIFAAFIPNQWLTFANIFRAFIGKPPYLVGAIRKLLCITSASSHATHSSKPDSHLLSLYSCSWKRLS